MDSDLKAAILPVTPLQQNCSILWSAKSGAGAVVDPGGEVDRILRAAEQQEVTLEKVLVTHGHVDHAGGVAALARRVGLPIEGPHPEDRFWIDAMAEQGRMFGVPDAEPFTPDRWLADGEEVTVGGHRLQVLHCPGHTPGHVVFFAADARLAAVGDVLFHGSIGRSDFPGGDQAALIRSIRDKLFPLGDDVTFIPGHGPTSTFGAERVSNPFVADRLFA